MSSMFVVSVIVGMLLSARPVRPFGALATAANLGAYGRRETSGARITFHTPLRAIKIGPDGPPRSSRAARRRGYKDPLEPHRAIVGPDTRTPWYIRVRAVILLVLIVAALGIAFAAITLTLIASGRFLLELLAG